jgi:hypothetical protein
MRRTRAIAFVVSRLGASASKRDDFGYEISAAYKKIASGK